MNGLVIELGGPAGSRLGLVRVQGEVVHGRVKFIDVGVLIERPAGAWQVRAYEGGNAFAEGLRFTDFLEAVEVAAKG
jgi:hypothetical protein